MHYITALRKFQWFIEIFKIKWIKLNDNLNYSIYISFYENI